MPVVKLGVIAPFEGLGRPLGYALLPEIQENAAGVTGRYGVAVIALDDSLYGPAAQAQAQALALDPDVVAVIGPWTDATVQAALPVLVSAELPALPAAALAAPSDTKVLSLCPPAEMIAHALLEEAGRGENSIALAGPENALATALISASPELVRASQEPSAPAPTARVVLHTGQAAEAAADLHQWREKGWEGALLGGPDLAQPWFGAHAGKAGEGARAVVCTAGASSSSAEEAATDATVSLADAASDIALAAIAASGRSGGKPTREGVAEYLALQHLDVGLRWLEFSSGAWSSRSAK